jgi:hypothetical protein
MRGDKRPRVGSMDNMPYAALRNAMTLVMTIVVMSLVDDGEQERIGEVLLRTANNIEKYPPVGFTGPCDFDMIRELASILRGTDLVSWKPTVIRGGKGDESSES